MRELVQNSSIKAWLGFPYRYTNGDFAPLPAIENYTINGTITNCTHVCADTDSLFDPFTPANLVTCGLWVTVSTVIAFGALSNNSKYTAPFEDLGLSIVDSGFVNQTDNSTLDDTIDDTLGIISNCFSFTCAYRNYYGSAVCDACQYDMLFGAGAIDWSAIHCLYAICCLSHSDHPLTSLWLSENCLLRAFSGEKKSLKRTSCGAATSSECGLS